jgi:hypothetical protein
MEWAAETALCFPYNATSRQWAIGCWAPISRWGPRGKGIGFADRPVAPQVPRSRGPLDSLATKAARAVQDHSIDFRRATRHWPHATPGRAGSLFAAGRQAPLGPTAPWVAWVFYSARRAPRSDQWRPLATQSTLADPCARSRLCPRALGQMPHLTPSNVRWETGSEMVQWMPHGTVDRKSSVPTEAMFPA